MKKAAVCFAIFSLLLAGVSLGMAEDTGGKKIYATCVGCHGVNGENMALGVSKPLKGQTADQVLEKLNGYAAGTFGGNKKGVMMSIAKRLKEEDRVKVAEYISTFE
ncbi:c-type cytochrome [Halodesulfovibrio aestuarii]|uniref:c-type cytochrome n=1 Tax=Halodesulfovibrio aestuarii TaxID=126333 RepID=UPI003D335FE9